MKVAILAGGRGSRLAEETDIKPKPMVEIGGHPILWHIMMHYSHYGFEDFLIALGYKGEVIKKYMTDYATLDGSFTVHMRSGHIETHEGDTPNWNVGLIETGMETMTGGRIKRLAPFIGNETFMLTWGDGVSDVNLHQLLDFHRSHGKYATMTIVRPPARYGYITLDDSQVTSFTEKPQLGEGWIITCLDPAAFKQVAAPSDVTRGKPFGHLSPSTTPMAKPSAPTSAPFADSS